MLHVFPFFDPTLRYV